MPDIDMHNIIKGNIHLLGAEQTGDSDNCCTNRPLAQREIMNQETNRAEKCYTKTDSISKSNYKNKATVENQLCNTVKYFLSGPSYDSDKEKSTELMQQLQRDFEDVFNGIGWFDDTFLIQLKLDSKPYQVPPRCMTYTLQKPFEGELKGYKTRHNITSRC